MWGAKAMKIAVSAVGHGVWLLALLVAALKPLDAEAAPRSDVVDTMIWDAFAVVKGQLRVDGTIMACVNADAVLAQGKCVLKGLIGKVVGEPMKMTAQELLDARIGQELGGRKALALGVLPHWRSSGGKRPRPVIAEDEFVIVYKVVAH